MPQPRPSRVYKRIRVFEMAGSLGAEIHDVDFAKLDPADEETRAEIRQAFHDNGVIFFRNQWLTPQQHKAAAAILGKFDKHPIVKGSEDHPEILVVTRLPNQPCTFGETWHSDNSYLDEPSLGSCLYGREIPPFGNDTLWSNMYHIYESFSPGMRKMLDSLIAVHSASRAFANDSKEKAAKYAGDGPQKYQVSEWLTRETEHPVVRTHPVTGRKALYVNSMFTLRFKDWSENDSRPLLEQLFRYIEQTPEYQVRFRWAPGSMAMWDNRCTQHFAINDNHIHKRVMARITVQGDKPF